MLDKEKGKAQGVAVLSVLRPAKSDSITFIKYIFIKGNADIIFNFERPK